MILIDLNFDGACDNNSKLKYMGIGVAVRVNGEYRHELGQKAMIGTNGTNNIAEWRALQLALTMARDIINRPEFKGEHISLRIYGDSQLVVNQFNGEWKMKKPHLVPLYHEAHMYCSKVKPFVRKFAVIWIRREENTEADKLSKAGILDFLKANITED